MDTTTVTHPALNKADQAVQAATSLAQSWSQVAGFLADNPDIAANAGSDQSTQRMHVFVGHKPDPVTVIADAARTLPQTLRRVDVGDEALAELEVLIG